MQWNEERNTLVEWLIQALKWPLDKARAAVTVHCSTGSDRAKALATVGGDDEYHKAHTVFCNLFQYNRWWVYIKSNGYERLHIDQYADSAEEACRLSRRSANVTGTVAFRAVRAAMDRRWPDDPSMFE